MQTKRLHALSGIMLCVASASHAANNAAHMPNQAIQAVAQVAVLVLAANPIGGALPNPLIDQRNQAHDPLYPQAKHSDAYYRRLALLANKRENKNTRKTAQQKSYNRTRNNRLNQPQTRRGAQKNR